MVFVLVIGLSIAGCGKDSSQISPLAVKADTSDASLAISPGETSVPMQWTSKLKASVSLLSGYTEDISEYARWESSDASIATIGNDYENKGVITGIAPGSVIVTARFTDLSATARITITQDNPKSLGDNVRVVFLHHDVGASVWAGGVPEWFADYNARNKKDYSVTGLEFPRKAPYGWNNNPYDYWNIWVNHAGASSFKEEPTLGALAKAYNVIIWKHSFPVSSILPDAVNAGAQPYEKTMLNYKLEYKALKNHMKSFPKTRFIVWTGAAIVQGATPEDQAQRAREFFEWVRNEWDEPGDNIYLWDFFELQTDGGNYLKAEYSAGEQDSNLNQEFSKRVAPYFCKRVVDVIEGRGDTGSLVGK